MCLNNRAQLNLGTPLYRIVLEALSAFLSRALPSKAAKGGFVAMIHYQHVAPHDQTIHSPLHPDHTSHSLKDFLSCSHNIALTPILFLMTDNKLSPGLMPWNPQATHDTY